jgi:hypothetical protein
MTRALLLAFALLFSSTAFAAEKSARTVSIDLGYIPQLTNNRAMWNLWLEYEYLGSSLFDWVDDKAMGESFLTRLVWAGAAGYLWPKTNYSLFVANHEYGHGAREASLGGVPYYTWNGGGRHISIFSFILQGFGQYGNGAYAESQGNSITPAADWIMNTAAGGMNNSMMFAEHLEDEVYYNTGHPLQAAAYMWAKSDPRNYADSTDQGFAGDLSNLLTYWNAKGYGISSRDVRTGSYVALAASFTSWTYVYSGLRYVATGDPQVHAWSVGAFKLPDISFFQNRRGISYRLRTGIRDGKRTFPISVEYVYKGTPTLELSFGIRNQDPIGGVQKTGSLMQAYLSTAGGGGVRFAKDFASGSSSFFSAGAGAFTAQSLEGERVLSRMLTSKLGVEFWGRWSLIW